MNTRSRDIAQRLVDEYQRMSFSAFLLQLETVAAADLPEFLSVFVSKIEGSHRLLASKAFEPYLWVALDEVWRRGDIAEEVAAAQWVAISTLHQQFPGLSFAQSTGIRKTAQGIRNGRDRLRALRGVADALRDPEISSRWEVFGGLYYLLVDIAKEAFREREIGVAYAEAAMAWELRGSLPQTSRSVQAFVAGASQLCAAACYLPEGEFRKVVESVDGALTVAWDLVESLVDDLTSADRSLDAVVTLALAHENLARARVRNGLDGYLAGFELTIAIARRAFADLSAMIGFPDLEDLLQQESPLPPLPRVSSRNGIRKLLVSLGYARLMTGDREAAELAYELAGSIEPHEIARIENALDAASRSDLVSHKVRMAEELLRTHGALSEFNPHQRARLAKRYADYLRDTAASLNAAKLFTSSAFWSFQANEIVRSHIQPSAAEPNGEVTSAQDEHASAVWAPGPRSIQVSNRPTRNRRRTRSRAGVAGGPTADVAVPIDEVAAEQALERATRNLEDVRSAIARENPLALVVILKSLVISRNPTPSEVDSIRTLMEEVRGWQPRGRTSVSVVPASSVSSDEMREFLLASAVDFAEVFKPGLVPELLRAASRLRTLPGDRRRAYAERSALTASRLERYNQEALALIDVILLGIETNEPIVVEGGVNRLDAFLRSWGQHQGVVDLLDVIDWSTKKVMGLVPHLVGFGAVQSAVELLESASGRLTQLLELRPHLVEGYGLLESSFEDSSGDGQVQLFAALARSIAESPVQGSFGPSSARRGSFELANHEAAVHLVRLAGRLGAIGRHVDGGGKTTWFALELGCSYSRLPSLAGRVWAELRPTRHSKPAGALATLDELVVAPLRHELSNVDRVTFSLHGDAALLPLHAARGPAGFLIQQMEVSYDIGVGRGRMLTPTGKGALVIGWDHEIQADTEAQMVRGELEDAIDGPIGPSTDEAAIDNVVAGERLEVIHVAAHGHVYSWPRSLQSYISIEPSRDISAHTWLANARPADFVFLNVCKVGYSVPVAGDVNGFPLALIVKGARAVVSAAGLIEPHAAQSFAHDFYRELQRTNSVTAFRAAACASIARSNHPSDWAPFLHYGGPYALARRT